MKNRYRITVSDYRGARHYTLTQVMLRLLAGAGCIVGLVVLGGVLVIHLLSGKVERLGGELALLEANAAAVRGENERLLAEQHRLNRAVEDKARELLMLGDELEQIESLIGLKPSPSLPLNQRMNVAAQTALEKQIMLDSVPSGLPLEDTLVTSGFGTRMHPVHREKTLHGGVDLRAARSTPVFATADGVVEYADHDRASGMGKMIKLVHNYGFSTLYAHLDQIEVSVGDYVQKGELIARSGNTGVTSAPHLHYEVRYLGRRLNPEPFLDWSLDRYDLVFNKEERVQWESLAETIRRKASAMERPLSPPAPSLSAISP